VIVGAGFAGLAAAHRLASAPADILVIDRHNYNLFQPLLYQVATAGLSPADIAAPVRSLLRASNTRVLLDEVVDVDPAARQVRMRSGKKQGYDVLILATGSEYNYFGHDEWRELAPGLKSSTTPRTFGATCCSRSNARKWSAIPRRAFDY
jgi:NADH dehydrogenase FAD-containing subunit